MTTIIVKPKSTTVSVALSSYRDQHFKGSRTEQERLLLQSTTLYVGNLSFFTTEEQIHELFSRCGDIKRIIMGLDKVKKTPCGFCFVEYYTREEAENALRYVNGTRLDDRIIRTDWDTGFKEGRQYGRGKSGGQNQDCHWEFGPFGLAKCEMSTDLTLTKDEADMEKLYKTKFDPENPCEKSGPCRQFSCIHIRLFLDILEKKS